MDIQHIVSALRDEKDRLEQAIAALEGGNGRRHGRAAGLGNGRRGKRRRRLSAAAKKRISEMMKKRWAERKKAAKAA